MNGILPFHLSENISSNEKKIMLFLKISHKIVSVRILQKRFFFNESVNSFIIHFRRHLPFSESLKVYSVPTPIWFVNSTESQQRTFSSSPRVHGLHSKFFGQPRRCFIWRPLSGAGVYSPTRAAASQVFLF